MKVIISSSQITGKITAPTSKSYLQRAMAASLLTKGKSQIKFNNFCDDTFAALNLIKTLGAKITSIEEGLSIEGGIEVKTPILDCFESGLCIRLFSPIAALSGNEMTLIGSGSLLSRPQSLIENSLNKFGVSVETNESFPPIFLKGPLKPGKEIVDGSLSSQLISGLLMSLPLLDEDSELVVENMVSHRYVDMTIDVLNKFGVEIIKNSKNVFRIKGNQKYSPTTVHVEGDWSGASFIIVAALINGSVSISGLRNESLQADKSIFDLASSYNYSIQYKGKVLEIEKSMLDGFEFDATNCPDLFPSLFSLAACSNGMSKIRGVHRLKHKESDRANTLMIEFKKLGIHSYIEDDCLFVEGGKIKSAVVSSHNDHRIAMALSVAGLSSEKEVIVEGVECINKSYPGFIDDLLELKGNMRIKH